MERLIFFKKFIDLLRLCFCVLILIFFVLIFLFLILYCPLSTVSPTPHPTINFYPESAVHAIGISHHSIALSLCYFSQTKIGITNIAHVLPFLPVAPMFFPSRHYGIRISIFIRPTTPRTRVRAGNFFISIILFPIIYNSHRIEQSA